MKKLDNSHGTLLSVVFSFRNEEKNLPELVPRLRSVLATELNSGAISDYELVFVNDASTDRSLDILREEARGHKDIKIVNMSRTFGHSACVFAGFRYAAGDIVIYMDADLQDPPEVIPDMIKVWKDRGNADVVHTVRMSRAGEPRIKLWITRLGYFILNRTSDIGIIPNAGDFKLLTRRVIDYLTSLNEKKPFMRGLVQWIGFKQEIVYYHRAERYSGKSKFFVLGPKVIMNFLESALISFSDAPLYLIAVFGFFVAFSSFLLLGYVLVGKYLNINVPGYTGIMATMLFLGGVQLISIGIIGLYLSSIYLENKGRPNYIVESTFGFDDSGTVDRDSRAPQKQR